MLDLGVPGSAGHPLGFDTTAQHGALDLDPAPWTDLAGVGV
jgi:hypothetical protein